jgi:uncharacterized membrane protein YgcG
MKNKVFFALVLLLALAAVPVHAQGSEPPIPAAPAKGSYILDQLDWLTADQETNINAIIQGLDHDGVAEMAVVTLDDCGSDKQAYRKSLFDTWGIGHADDNDGLLILVCWYGGDASRRSVEQLYGRGLEGMLTSDRTGEIAQDYFVPAFKADKPGEGLVGMVRTYNVLLRTSMNSTNSRNYSNPIAQEFQGGFGWILVPLVGFILAALFLHFFRNHPNWTRFRADDWLHSYRDNQNSGDHWNDHDSFGGGNSDGGGGSSTRF